MAWETPKTDWKIEYADDGSYLGDYFEPEDYNRIKNNIVFLHDYALQVYGSISEIEDAGEDVYYGSSHEMTASWWTCIQDSLAAINEETVKRDIGTPETFQSNSAGRLLEELNRIESATLFVYTKLHEIEDNKQRLAFRLGNWHGI